MVVDVSNSPSFDDDPAMEFFTKSTTNLPAAAKDAGIRHYVAVSIVGCDQLPKSGYLRAKVAQEKLIEESELPYSRACTQFAEFADAITASMTVGREICSAVNTVIDCNPKPLPCKEFGGRPPIPRLAPVIIALPGQHLAGHVTIP